MVTVPLEDKPGSYKTLWADPPLLKQIEGKSDIKSGARGDKRGKASIAKRVLILSETSILLRACHILC